MLHTLHRGQRDTRLCPLISYILLLFTLYCCSVPRVLLYFPPSLLSLVPLLRRRSPASRAPARSITTCSHHRNPTCAPGALSNPSHSSNSDRVAMYCATIFWRRLMCSSTTKTPAGVRILFKCCGTGGTDIQIGYLGGHPPHGQGPGRNSRTKWQYR